MGRVIAGSLLIFFGLFMLLGFLVSTKESGLLVTLLMLAMFVAAPVGLGVWLIRGHRKRKDRMLQEQTNAVRLQREKEVLRIARRKGGIITLSDVVEETSLSSDEADEVMREFVIRQMAGISTTDRGTVVYEFFEMALSREEEERRGPDQERLIQ